jgi:hypothetical protein
MLRSFKDLKDYTIGASDGSIGAVKDLYFDDHAWVIRYLVVDTGPWLFSRKVLISPRAIHQTNWASKLLPVSLTREEVRLSPNIDTDKPVSRQHEMDYLGYYGYPYYWGGTGLWGEGMYPNQVTPGYAGFGSDEAARAEADAAQAAADEMRKHSDPHLRSCDAVVGYHVHATDGEIGNVKGMLVDEETWAIRYFVVTTSNWWGGHLVLVAPQWIKDISFSEQMFTVELSRQAIQEAPPYDDTVALSREQEILLQEHYGHVGYWIDEMEHESAV